MNNAVKKIICYLGSQKKLASICNVSQQAVSVWLKKGIVPAKHVLKIEKATDSNVPRYELNPKFYPPELFQKSKKRK